MVVDLNPKATDIFLCYLPFDENYIIIFKFFNVLRFQNKRDKALPHQIANDSCSHNRCAFCDIRNLELCDT